MLMLKILIVGDDEKLSQLYKIVLNKAGYEAVLVSNGQEAWDTFGREHIDLVVTDVMMPVLNGYDLVKILRNENPLIPVLMITAKDDHPPKSKDLTLSIDDYMTKPIDVNEMVLRVKTLMCRANINQGHRLMVGATCLDYDSLTVFCGEDSIMLPQKEFLFLYKLASYPNEIFTRIQLMDEIWGSDIASDVQTIDVHINRLRRHFEHNHDFKIMTVRGLGYKAVVRWRTVSDCGLVFQSVSS